MCSDAEWLKVSRGLAAHDHHGTVRKVQAMLADRAQQDIRESAVPPAADDQQIGIRRGIKEHLGRDAMDDLAPHQPAIAGADGIADRFGQRLLRAVLEGQ